MEMAAEKAYDLYQNLKADTADKIYGKMEVLEFSCRVETMDCVSWAKIEFDKWKNNKTEKNT